jgi:hypothetical protein
MRWMVIYGYEVPGGALNLSYTELLMGIFPFKEKTHGRAGNRTWDFIISIQKLLPLDHEAG